MSELRLDGSLVRLGSVLTGIDAGHSPDLEDTPAGPGEWGVLKVSAVRDDGFHPEENKVVRDRVFFNPTICVHEGDLLITRANTAQLVGRSCIAENVPPGLMLCDKTLRLRVDERIIPTKYVQMALGMPEVRRQIEIAATGTSGSMKNISQQSIRQLMIPIGSPDRAGRQRITEVFDSIDYKMRSIEELIAKLRATRLATINDLLGGAYDQSLKRERLGDIVAHTVLGTAGRGADSSGPVITLLKMGSLLHGTITLDQTETLSARRVLNLSDILLRDNDLLFNTRNTPDLVGKVGVWHREDDRFVPDNNLLIIRFRPGVYADYICMQLTYGRPSRDVRNLATGTTSVAAIYWRDLRRVIIPIPNPVTQLSFIRKIQAFDRQLANLRHSLLKLYLLKQGLMDDLLTGRVRVPVG
jgi:type I restriction enzyme S subunit